MLIDSLNLFSQDQAVTATAASTNSLDHGEARGLGYGENMYLVVLVTEAFTDSGSDSTVAVTVETDDNSGFSSATTTQTVGTFAALSAVGTRLIARVAPGCWNERYSQLKYTVAGGNLSTGKLTAFLTHDVDAYSSYPTGSHIS